MSITLKKDVWKVKDPSSGQYRGAAILSTTLPEDAAQIIADTEVQLSALETETQADVNTIIANAQTSINGINTQLNDPTNGIVSKALAEVVRANNEVDALTASITSAIQNGVDRTLTRDGVPADAKVTGMSLRDTKNAFAGVATANLFDLSSTTDGYYIDSNGDIQVHATACYSDQIPVVTGRYVIRGFTVIGPWNLRIHAYDANDEWVQQLAGVTAGTNTSFDKQFTVDPEIHFIRLSIYEKNYLQNLTLMRAENGIAPSAEDFVARDRLDELNTWREWRVLFDGYEINKVTVKKGLDVITGSLIDKDSRAVTNGFGLGSYTDVEAISLNNSDYYMRLYGYSAQPIKDSTYYVGASDFVPCDGKVNCKKHDWVFFCAEFVRADGAAMTESDAEAIAQMTLLRRDFEAENQRFGMTNMRYSGLLPMTWLPGGIVYNNGKLSENQRYVHTDRYIPVEPGETLYYVKGNTSRYLHIFEYSEANEESFVKVSSMPTAKDSYTLSQTTKYIRFQYVWGEDPSRYMSPDIAAESVAVWHSDSPLSNWIKKTAECNTPLDLHEIPQSQGALNVIKRARQLTDIVWTPAYDIPRVSMLTADRYEDHIYFNDKFTSGVTYQGVPYSQRNYVGTSNGLSAFATSVVSAGTLEETESDYIDVNTASYYGTNCVGLVSWALNIPLVSSTVYHKVPGLSAVLNDTIDNWSGDDFDEIQLCDVLVHVTHVAIITDIIRDEDNHVIYIEVSESTKAGNANMSTLGSQVGGVCRRKMWSREEFAQWFGIFKLYRYASNLLDSIPYIPSPYVPMSNEGKPASITDMPLIPIKGDYCRVFTSSSISASRTIRLIVRCSGFTHVRVRQNGIDYGELLPITDGYVDVILPQNADAVFTAHLCNAEETQVSASCHFLGMRTASLSGQRNGGTVTITLERNNPLVVPHSVSFGDQANYDGAVYGVYALVTEYTREQGQSASYKYTFTVAIPELNGTYTSIPCLVRLDAGNYGFEYSALFNI